MEYMLATSRGTRPNALLHWTFEVADELIVNCGEEWSEPVRFRFQKSDNGRVDIALRTVDA